MACSVGFGGQLGRAGLTGLRCWPAVLTERAAGLQCWSQQQSLRACPRPPQDGETAMHWAAQYGCTKIVALLDKANGDLHKVTDKVRHCVPGPVHSERQRVRLVTRTLLFCFW